MNTNVRPLETDWRTPWTKASVSGTGTAQVLPMSEEDMERKKDKTPIGFVVPRAKPKRVKKKA